MWELKANKACLNVEDWKLCLLIPPTSGGNILCQLVKRGGTFLYKTVFCILVDKIVQWLPI